jgi:hypothetical protein
LEALKTGRDGRPTWFDPASKALSVPLKSCWRIAFKQSLVSKLQEAQRESICLTWKSCGRESKFRANASMV